MKRLLLSLTLCLFAVAPAFADDPPSIVDLPAKGGDATAVAVVYSGDGGWRDLDKTIGEWLSSQQHYHVVGVDTLKSFWSDRKPDQIAKDLAGIVATADPSGKLPVLIIGYSFGADVFPFAWDKLSPDLADRIRLVALLAPERTTGFHVSVAGWVGVETGDFDTVPAIATMPAERVLCVYGAEEKADTACTHPTLAAIEKLETPGSHHFDEKYIPLARKIVAAFEARQPKP